MIQVDSNRDRSCMGCPDYIANELGALEMQRPWEKLDYSRGAFGLGSSDNRQDSVIVIAGSCQWIRETVGQKSLVANQLIAATA